MVTEHRSIVRDNIMCVMTKVAIMTFMASLTHLRGSIVQKERVVVGFTIQYIQNEAKNKATSDMGWDVGIEVAEDKAIIPRGVLH